MFVGLISGQKAAHPGHQFGRVEGLGQVIVRTGPESLAAGLGVVLRQKQDRRGMR